MLKKQVQTTNGILTLIPSPESIFCVSVVADSLGSSTLCPTDEAISCTGIHTLSQANVDSVHIINTATATASPRFGSTSEESNTISAGDDDTVSWLLYPAISVGER